jgi:hypothetical protein
MGHLDLFEIRRSGAAQFRIAVFAAAPQGTEIDIDIAV